MFHLNSVIILHDYSSHQMVDNWPYCLTPDMFVVSDIHTAACDYITVVNDHKY